MSENITQIDFIRFEFFEKLFPVLVYSGTKEEQDSIIKMLNSDGDSFIHDLFAGICEQDNVGYPYGNNDFKVKKIEAGGIYFIQIQLPGLNTNMNDIKRAYIAYMQDKETGEIKERGYFTIKYFMESGTTFVLYIDSKSEGYIGNELTEKADDIDYEIWSITRDFVSIMVGDWRKQEKAERKKAKRETKNKE